ncbi:choice-of-anchor J domain-containing protein [Aureitalea sp. L0-47]|uniref:DUF5689 domain-containing protein n=1 Tax=Aureitalea sp. L0-47 TaxID=2816962 RepID=UPI002237578A|nr:DUF5689 domain-containing protein [Aureitalea sp. L0-47]MCW5518297.1 choice-of-anchor J domain-containing protein [Aureitalea sp. L0-47]
MKKKPVLKIAILTFASLCLITCEIDEFDIPLPKQQPFEITGTEVSFRALRAALDQQITNTGNPLLTVEEDLYLSGYVISSDEQGNFFEELIIQDKHTDPESGIRVKIDVNPLFSTFEKGRKVHVKLQQLTVGLDNGQLTIGYREGNRIGPLSESRMFDFLKRDTIVAEVEPMNILISELNDTLVNTYVRLSDMQFHRNEVLGSHPLTFSAEPGDQFDGERILESCIENSTIILSTSVFADFSAVELPAGMGSIEGIFTYNFFGDEYNLVINHTSNIDMAGTDRCDPMQVDCGVVSEAGSEILFTENFEDQIEGEPILGNGWTNYAEAGTEVWEAYFDDGSNASLGISARMGAYMSGDDNNIGWLITPEIDFDQQEGEELHFKTSNSFADNSTLEIFFSSNWDGEPESIISADWQILSNAIIVQDDDFFGDWIFSGYIDLSCIEGAGHIAWKYVGSGDPDSDGTYELDDIEITSN